ncbi:hypothetical protein HCN44_004768 [Aphidius gifuensis]|uniref:Uncharacterized protein n=1 Tax=Aphidius gifuensis TaxID=684658 RepID=A0A834XLV4_APHGI|nr:hypothetical protein HCN44_004768 [Aphidius gifuensis]
MDPEPEDFMEPEPEDVMEPEPGDFMEPEPEEYRQSCYIHMQAHEKVGYRDGLARYLRQKGFILKQFTVGRTLRYFYCDEILLENQQNVFVVQAEVYQPCSPAPLIEKPIEKLVTAPAPLTEPERHRIYRAKIKEQKLQNNRDEILAASPVPLTNAERSRNYRARQKELQNNPDEIVGLSPAPLTEAKRHRIYRAKIKEQKIQNNPDEILSASPVPLTNAERSRNYRARQKEIQNNLDEIVALSPAPSTEAELNDVKKADINNNKLDIDTSDIINRIKQVPDVKQVDDDNNKLDIGNVADIKQIEDFKKADDNIKIIAGNFDDDIGASNKVKVIKKPVKKYDKFIIKFDDDVDNSDDDVGGLKQVKDVKKADDNGELDIGNVADIEQVEDLKKANYHIELDVDNLDDDVGGLNQFKDVEKADDNNGKLDINTSDIMNETKQVDNFENANNNIKPDIGNFNVGGTSNKPTCIKQSSKKIRKVFNKRGIKSLSSRSTKPLKPKLNVKAEDLERQRKMLRTIKLLRSKLRVKDVKKAGNNNGKLYTDTADSVDNIKHVKDFKKADDNIKLDIGNFDVRELNQIKVVGKGDNHDKFMITNFDDDVGKSNQIKDDLNQAENNNDNFDIGTADAVEMKEVEDNIKDDDNNNKLDENRAEHPKKYNKRVFDLPKRTTRASSKKKM